MGLQVVLKPTSSYAAESYLRIRYILTQKILPILINPKVFNMSHVRALQDYVHSRNEPTNAHWQNMFQHLLLTTYINLLKPTGYVMQQQV